MTAPKPSRAGIHIILPLVLSLVPVAVTAQGPELTEEERLFLQGHGPVRYVYGLEIPPNVFTDKDGQTKGATIDLLSLMNVKLGIEFQVVRAANFSAALQMMRNGEADLMGPITPSAERDAFLDFTEPYVAGTIGFWTRANETELADVDDLVGKRIGVIASGTSYQWLRENHPDLTTVGVNETLEGLLKLQRGELDAFFGGFGIVAFYIRTEGIEGLKAIGATANLIDAGWAVPNGHQMLLSIVNRGMESVSREELTQIFVKWTGYDLAPAVPGPPLPPFYATSWFRWTAGGAVGAVTLVSVWAFALRTQVLRRTTALRSSEEHLRTVVTMSAAAIVNVGPDGRILDANRAAERLFGYPLAELRRRSLSDIVHPDEREQNATMLASLKNGRRDEVTIDERYVTGGGSVVWTQTAAVAVRDKGGQLRFVVCAMQDLTERRNAEETKRRAIEQEAENRRLKEVSRFRSEFINAAAHELNTPLTPLKIHLKLLQAGNFGPVSPKQSQSIEILERNLGRLQALVQDMLDIARLESGRLTMRPEPVDLSLTVQEGIETFDHAARAAGLTLEFDTTGPVRVNADAKRITQVLYNLLSNALKFTPAGGVVAVSVRQEGERAVVEVRDTGIGFSEEEKNRLFQPFAQIQTEKPGTGLGLYISQGLITAHGGWISAESQGPGRGARFTFTLPLAKAPPVDHDGGRSAKEAVPTGDDPRVAAPAEP